MKNPANHKGHIIIVGAGPAGLTAAHRLITKQQRPIVLEKEDKPGGVARTESYKSYHFDIGGHRFFTRQERIQRLWEEMLGDDFITVSRKSRIYYRKKYYDYPLNLIHTLKNLGLWESARILISYLKSQLNPHPHENTFEEWVSNRFGQRLYETFFKTYTEKVWGLPCSQILSKWAAQRIKGLSLRSAVLHALVGGQESKTLINAFQYPKKGPGMMWQRMSETISAANGRVIFQAPVNRLYHKDNRITQVSYMYQNSRQIMACAHLISTVSIPQFILMLDPKPPENIRKAANHLSFRSFLIVMLILNRKSLFPDQWIYIHNPDVRVGRIQNFKNWSSDMVPDASKTSIGMEYFCDQDDAFWNKEDDELTRLAIKELSDLDLAQASDVIDSYIVRQPNAYPVYDRLYESNLHILRDYLDTFENLHTIGRNGMHRYNNMDHSMLSGILAVDNIMGASHDLWQINEEEAYLES